MRVHASEFPAGVMHAGHPVTCGQIAWSAAQQHSSVTYRA